MDDPASDWDASGPTGGSGVDGAGILTLETLVSVVASPRTRLPRQRSSVRRQAHVNTAKRGVSAAEPGRGAKPTQPRVCADDRVTPRTYRGRFPTKPAACGFSDDG